MTKKRIFFHVHQIVNLATQLTIVDTENQDFQKNSDDVEILEMTEEELTFICPEGALIRGHLVMIKGSIHDTQTTTPVTMTAKVLDVNKVAEILDCITVHLIQHNKDLWKNFLIVQRSEQIRLETLFSAMRDMD